MTVNFYMLGTFVIYKIGNYMKGCLTITIKMCCLRMRNKEIFKQREQPHKFTTCGCHRSIFCFSRRSRYSLLFLRLPGNKGITKKNTITCYTLPSIQTPCPIRIAKAFNCKSVLAGKKKKPLSWRSLDMLVRPYEQHQDVVVMDCP